MLNLEHVSGAVAEALLGLRRRTTFHPLPAEGFDPLQVDDGVRWRYGLPLLDNQPSSAFRRAFLSRPSSGNPLRFVLAETGAPIDGGLLRARTTVAATYPWPAQKSSNWSGGYVSPREGRSLTGIMGNWTVPAVAAPAGGTEAEYRSSTWIGLDGQRLYQNASLPQIGTSQVWTAAGAPQDTYATWYQWWARGQHNPPYPLTLPVYPGNEVSAIITVLDPTTVRFNLKNVTLGLILQAFDVTAPPPCTISGATGEWIMERPSPMGSDGWHPYKLPAYAAFSFTDCSADSKSSGDTTSTQIDLASARLIRMYEIVKSPHSIRTISSAKKILTPQQALELSYVGP